MIEPSSGSARFPRDGDSETGKHQNDFDDHSDSNARRYTIWIFGFFCGTRKTKAAIQQEIEAKNCGPTAMDSASGFWTYGSLDIAVRTAFRKKEELLGGRPGFRCDSFRGTSGTNGRTLRRFHNLARTNVPSGSDSVPR